MSAELRTDIWVSALIRRVQAGGASAFVIHKGDEIAGAVLVKVARLDGTGALYGPATDMDGRRFWIDLTATAGGAEEAAIDAYVARRRRTDTDLWLVEIEDREGRSFLMERID
jgi:hypothetical protein